MKLLQTLVFLLLFKVSFCQELLPEALLIKNAYDRLAKNRINEASKKNYIQAFPSNSKLFISIFNADKFDQLYSVSKEYIDALQQSANSFPKEAISKCVDIGKNLTWDVDAVIYLQQASVVLAAQYPKLFAEKYNTLNDIEKVNLIRFYADAENHSAYPEYQALVDSLKKNGSSNIAKSLEAARIKRKKEKNH